MHSLLLTISIGERCNAISDLTSPRMRNYASKIGATFLLITEQKISKTYPYWEKFVIHDLLDSYDRILFLDTDVLVRTDCPNLFDLVPEKEIGMYNEGLLTTVKERAEHTNVIRKVCEEYKQPFPKSWDGRFYNTGVMIVSQNMKWLFEKPLHESFDNYWEQSYLNMRLVLEQKLSDVFDIGYKFNRMHYIDSKVSEHRTKSYIIHYAGTPDPIPIIQHDLEIWAKNKI